ncbi:uncharacterized protein BT62DRAFT_922679 [Guyanagaster necrorhizus]|uniref:Uncharacterized protein n=1 Tax=Guyanagaster necrorhizus TaxID=856835 RepID=A0A9P7VLH0_9AGAR|nr:uncharacterized protein BT62DRAFT_922679 [Guyanagaster necrorhizus MCA 3950]KAG7442530.1 hypothetical protein BT62DRAFT_922679 [Guyanagaster necrorhizus MCA 3950]
MSADKKLDKSFKKMKVVILSVGVNQPFTFIFITIVDKSVKDFKKDTAFAGDMTAKKAKMPADMKKNHYKKYKYSTSIIQLEMIEDLYKHMLNSRVEISFKKLDIKSPKICNKLKETFIN